MSYTFQGPPDLSAVPPDLHQGLVMLLVDGRRGADDIVALSPMDEALTRQILEELEVFGVTLRGGAPAPPAEESATAAAAPAGMGVITRKPKVSTVWVNPKAKKKKEAPPYMAWPIFSMDPKHPPAAFMAAIPTLTGEVDPGQITGDASEYYLLSRIDGSTPVEALQSLTAMSMPLMVRRLCKHASLGSLTFDDAITAEFLGGREEPEQGSEGDAGQGVPPGETPASDQGYDEVPLSVYALIEDRMVDDPGISGPLRRTGAALPAGGFQASDLTQKECLSLSLVQEGTLLGEIASNGPGEDRDILRSMLDLFRRGCLNLSPPDRPSQPTARVEPPVTSPIDDLASTTLEMDILTTGEFSMDGFAEMLAAANEEATAPTSPPAVAPTTIPAVAPTTTPAVAPTSPPAVAPTSTPAAAPMLAPALPAAPHAPGPAVLQGTNEMLLPPKAVLRGTDRAGYEAEWVDPPHEGEIAQHPFQKLFGFIQEGRRTGILHVRRGKNHRNVWFAHGQPVYATSDEAEDRLGSLLWKSEVIDKQTYLEFERECRKQPDREAWEVLEEMLILVPDELMEGRRRQLVHITARLFHEVHGQYLWIAKERLQSDLSMFSVNVEDIHAMIAAVSPKSVGAAQAAPPAPAPPPAAAPAPPPAAAPATPREARQHPKNSSDWVGEHMDLFVTVTDESADKLRSLRLGEKERRFVNAVCESRHRLRELMPMSSLGRTKTHQFLAALWSKHLIDFGEEIDREDEALRNLDSLNKWLVRLETGDLFHALGSHVSATLREIKAAYAKEKERFDVRKFAGREQAFLNTIDRINVILDRSYGHLLDTTTRRQYRVDQFGASRLRTFAEVQAKKADVILFFKQEYETARLLYESAWDLVPDDPLYLAHMGYCHFRAYYGSAQERTRGIDMVERALAAAAGKEIKVLLTAAMLERDRKNGGRMREYIARAKPLAGDPGSFRKLLTSYRLAE